MLCEWISSTQIEQTNGQSRNIIIKWNSTSRQRFLPLRKSVHSILGSYTFRSLAESKSEFHFIRSKKKLDTFHVVFPSFCKSEKCSAPNHCKQISNSIVNSSVIFFSRFVLFLMNRCRRRRCCCRRRRRHRRVLLVFYYCSTRAQNFTEWRGMRTFRIQTIKQFRMLEFLLIGTPFFAVKIIYTIFKKKSKF